jgi:hypothetical protein
MGCCQGSSFLYKWRQRRESAESSTETVQVCAERGRQCNCESECKCRFEKNTERKSETLGFVGLYWVVLSVYIIPSIIYNLLSPWTYPVLRNHVNLLVCVFICVCFRSSMHNKLVSEH